MRHTRPVLAAFLASLLVFTPPAAAEPPELRWKPCVDDATAQCTTLRVPVDEADGVKVGLAIARRPATQPARRIGTLVVNPGGPGGSGVDLALDAASFFSAEVRARFDIVGFDPRGVGRSAPVVCKKSLVDAEPSPLISTRDGYAALVAYHRKLSKDCAARTGPVYRHADTVSVVRDVERLRKALREKQISFYGASYGTLLGAQYAEKFPRRVRAVALDSVMDHSADTDRFLSDGTAAAQDGFDQFVNWCARYRTCALHGRDVRALWAALLAKAARGGLADPYHPPAMLSVFDLLGVAFSSFYDPQWYSLAYFIKEAGAPTGRKAPVVENSFPAVFCADWALPADGYAGYTRRLAEVRARAPQMPASPLALGAVAACLGRRQTPVNPQHALAKARVPTLLLASRHDPATPYLWAQRAATQLGPAATLVTYNGWGHVSYGRTACTTAVVDRFLIDLTAPAPGRACVGVIPDQFGVG